MDLSFRAAKVAMVILDRMRWVRSYYSSSEEGKLYCEYEAPGMKAVYEFNRGVRISMDHATVVQKLQSSMFR